MAVSTTEIKIREFVAGDEAAFRKLNEDWIERYFKVEAKDLASFENPQQKIIDYGGKILFALKDEELIGCCALLALARGEFEVAKMAVSESHRGGGVGRRLLEETIAMARGLGATRLYLETNDRLGPAIRLYESVGFRHLPPERITPSPYARANVYMEMLF